MPHVRIVAGRWRGRRITVPAGDAIRPTADRVREAWMNIVALQLADALVLDLFAGSGALGLEALSRGARRVDFVDAEPAALRVVQANADVLGAGDGAVLHRADAMTFAAALAPRAYDVAFADPPYRQGLARGLADQWLVAPFAGVLGIEHESGEAMPQGGVTRRYGATAITFYRDEDR